MFGSVVLLVYSFVLFQLYLIVLKLVYLIQIKKSFIETMNLGCFILCINLFEINIYDSLQILIKVRFFDLCGHKGRVKNRAKAMIYHLPFLHSHTHSHSFHPCDSVILVFVFLRFRSVFRSLSWNAQNLIDHYVIIMWSLERRFGQN